MRLQLILPRVEPNAMTPATTCPHVKCGGRHFRLHPAVRKPVRDTGVQQVTAHRYQCLRCRRTFRVYPRGVSAEHISQRVKGLGGMVYLLGLSYRAAALALEAMGVYECQTQVYAAVLAAARKVPGLTRRRVFHSVHTRRLGRM